MCFPGNIYPIEFLDRNVTAIIVGSPFLFIFFKGDAWKYRQCVLVRLVFVNSLCIFSFSSSLCMFQCERQTLSITHTLTQPLPSTRIKVNLTLRKKEKIVETDEGSVSHFIRLTDVLRHKNLSVECYWHTTVTKTVKTKQIQIQTTCFRAHTLTCMYVSV